MENKEELEKLITKIVDEKIASKRMLSRKEALIMVRNEELGAMVTAEINERITTRDMITAKGESAEVAKYQMIIKNRKALIAVIDAMLLEADKSEN